MSERGTPVANPPSGAAPGLPPVQRPAIANKKRRVWPWVLGGCLGIPVLLTVLVVAAFVPSFTPPTPPLSELRKIPEYRLSYPGCTEVLRGDVEAVRGIDVNVGSSSNAEWACPTASPPRVLDYLSAALSNRGWHRTSQAPVGEIWRKDSLIYSFSAYDPRTTPDQPLPPKAVSLHPMTLYSTDLSYDYRGNPADIAAPTPR